MSDRHPPNRLAREQSPYLRQHAHNPVDWYPWGPDALDRARREDKPILLSIGYSACHWCHVMERESFEDEAIAARMNRDFVCIKVDREERPDLDTVYMNAVQMLSGSGGWPLTVFLSPDGRPFYGGTYYPPEDRWGRPGFPRVLESLATAWRDRRDEVHAASGRLLDAMARLSVFEQDDSALRPETVARGAEAILGHVDRARGGLGSAPKFPNVGAFHLLLRRHRATGRPELLDAVRLTLDRMADGGIHDQLGGGFHRYSTDAEWLVPHFEKMLYDNAQLVPLFLDSHLVCGSTLHRDAAIATLDWMRREMANGDGFASAQDADSEGEEGLFYTWRIEEIENLLSPDEAAVLTRRYRVDSDGDFAEPGQAIRRSILHVGPTLAEIAVEIARPEREVATLLESARRKLLAAREKRTWPGRDDKVLTAWNALAIRAFARGAAVLDRPDLLEVALRADAFLERELVSGDGRLLRTWNEGVARYDATLEDHALLASARIDLFAATGDPAHLERARRLADAMLERFHDDAGGGFFLTASDGEALVDRPKPAFDGSIPSGNAAAAEALQRLGRVTGVTRYTDAAREVMRTFGGPLLRQPLGMAHLLAVLDDELRGPSEVVVAGPPNDPATRALLAAAHAAWEPGRETFLVDTERRDATLPEAVSGKSTVDGRPAAFVCRGQACLAPVTSPGALRAFLVT
ncbi:MAG: thioredoxin domain-containing protein [Alphaproteobacteria bacterium]